MVCGGQRGIRGWPHQKWGAMIFHPALPTGHNSPTIAGQLVMRSCLDMDEKSIIFEEKNSLHLMINIIG